MKLNNFRGDVPEVSAETKPPITCLTASALTSGFLKPIYWLGHPEKHLFSLSTKLFPGSKYPRNISFHFENGSTGSDAS